jgi:hypothetical protein
MIRRPWHLAARRQGNRIWYRIEDPCVTRFLDLALCLTRRRLVVEHYTIDGLLDTVVEGGDAATAYTPPSSEVW